MTKELTTTNNLEMLNTLRNTVAPGLSDSEFMLFAETVRATGLNPVTKEVWAIKAGGRLQIMTGINGFLRIANSHPAYDGMEVEFEWDGKALISATAKVYRKDRRFPSVATAYMAEYGKPTPIWKTMPSIMLSKCAKSLAIREAFISELGGLYTQEEMPSEYGAGYVNKNTGEIIEVNQERVSRNEPRLELDQEFADESKATKQAKKNKPVQTYYNLESVEPEKREAAIKYLEHFGKAEKISETIFKTKFRLERLTQFVDETYAEESKTQEV
jgi:phage recombination protein Bet